MSASSLAPTRVYPTFKSLYKPHLEVEADDVFPCDTCEGEGCPDCRSHGLIHGYHNLGYAMPVVVAFGEGPGRGTEGARGAGRHEGHPRPGSACEWSEPDTDGFRVCDTRKRLQQAVVEATKLPGGPGRTALYRSAMRAWADHQCEIVPVVPAGSVEEGGSRGKGKPSAGPALDRIERLVDRCERLYARSRTQTDMAIAHAEARAELTIAIRRYALDARLDKAREAP